MKLYYLFLTIGTIQLVYVRDACSAAVESEPVLDIIEGGTVPFFILISLHFPDIYLLQVFMYLLVHQK